MALFGRMEAARSAALDQTPAPTTFGRPPAPAPQPVADAPDPGARPKRAAADPAPSTTAFVPTTFVPPKASLPTPPSTPTFVPSAPSPTTFAPTAAAPTAFVPTAPPPTAPSPTTTPVATSTPSPFRRPDLVAGASPGAAHEPARLADRLPTAAAPVKHDALARLKAAATQTLYERLGPRLNDPNLAEDALRGMVMDELNAIVEESRGPLTAAERQRLIREVVADVLGLGPLQPLLDDPDITEVMVNGPSNIYVERAGRLTRTEVTFDDEAHLRSIIERIVSQVGRRIDESSPMVDARLLDGSRVNAIIPPLAVSGSTLTIRKFAREALKVPDLIRLGSFNPEMADLLKACVQARLNIIVSGGTGTGKTTFLNVLSSFLPEDERIISIEDAVELQLQQQHVVRLESRPPNVEGRGEVGIRDLVRNSLRMRPDRIVVGEVRGAEALDMLQAMNTGHDGSLSTIHANNPREALARLETLVLMAGVDLPLRAVREQVSSAVDVIVHLSRLRDGSRRVTHLTEVVGMEGQTITTQDVFLFDYSAGLDAEGRFLGHTVPTGIRPVFADKFKELGIPLAPSVFGGAEVWGRR